MSRTLRCIFFILTIIPFSSTGNTNSKMTAASATEGIEVLDIMLGDDREILLNKLKIMSPEMAHWVTDFAYGEVISRPQLDLRTRELSTIAALTAMGTAKPQLRTHIGMALNAGATPVEIIEVIMQMTVYAGFPAGLNGIQIAYKVFEEKKIKVVK